MPVSTLSLGSNTYELLDGLGATAVTKGSNTLISSENVITYLGIGGDYQPISNVTIKAASIQNFTADLGAGSDALNITGNVDSASILFGNQSDTGNNRLDIRGDLTAGSSVLGNLNNSYTDYSSPTYGEVIGRNQISGAAGNDSFKISGIVEDTNFYMAAGNDSLVIGGAAEDVYVNTGSGNDLVEFRGITNNNIIVQTDSGNDTVIFRNELTGDISSNDATSAVELGAGNDSLTLANGASYAEINTGSGKDTLRLTGSFDNTEFYLSDSAYPNTSASPNNSGDSISISSNSMFYDSSFSSINTLGDTLIVGSNSGWNNSDIYFADGNDSLVFGSNATFTDSRISLGDGADTLVFGSSTIFSDTTIDLGGDDLIDVVRFSSQSDFDDVQFIGYDDNDIYYIGAVQYTFGGNTSAFS